MSDGMKRMRLRIALGALVLLAAAAAWFYMVSFGY